MRVINCSKMELSLLELVCSQSWILTGWLFILGSRSICKLTFFMTEYFSPTFFPSVQSPCIKIPVMNLQMLLSNMLLYNTL